MSLPAYLNVRISPSSGIRTLDLTADKDSWVIGRSTGADLCIEDSAVSRTHAIVRRLEDGGFEIEDLRSTHGTFVDGRRIDRARLIVGSRVGVYGTLIVAESEPSERHLSTMPPRLPGERHCIRPGDLWAYPTYPLEEVELSDYFFVALARNRPCSRVIVDGPETRGVIYVRDARVVAVDVDGKRRTVNDGLRALLALRTGEATLRAGDAKADPTGDGIDVLDVLSTLRRR